jgi:hypothetical protein
MESQFLGVPVSVTADEEKGRWEGVGRTEGLPRIRLTMTLRRFAAAPNRAGKRQG